MDVLKEVYELALEKYAGDAIKAQEFTDGFNKEAFLGEAGSTVGMAALKGLGGGLAAGGLALGIHGLSSMMAHTNNDALHSKFEQVLAKISNENSLLKNANRSKVRSYGETVFKFAPHVAIDPNLLTAILSNAVHGEGIDPMTIRTLADLEKSFIESKKGALFTPKNYS